MQDTDTTLISDLLSAERIHVRLPSTSKEDVLNLMVDMLDGHPNVRDLEGVRHAVFQREELMSTGVGKELALPHAKTSCVRAPAASFAITGRPIDFDAMDGQPIRLVFLLISPESTGAHHIKLLSQISRLMYVDDFRERLLRARDASEVVDIFEEAEREIRDQ